MIGVIAFLFVKLVVPETKGRSLEDIEADLHVDARDGDPATATAGGAGRFERTTDSEERAPTSTRR